MINFNELENILLLAIVTGSITSLFVQKIKCSYIVKNDCMIVIASFILSMIIGTLFGISFANYKIDQALWIGFFTFLGAEAVYKILKNKFNIKSLSEIKIENLVEDRETTGQGADG